ncbi:MAG: hypothetical protein R3261_03555 [Alphaproteobacteria bacterium]|nr:hypothetical protein [Alphaproteobacteria bacterium]
MSNHLQGIVLGTIIGLVDCGLFMLSGMPITGLMALEAVLFWMAVGWVIHMIPLAVPNFIKGIIFAGFLNLPWIIEFAYIQSLPDMVVPMVGVAVVLGALSGFMSGLLKKRFNNHSLAGA